MEIRVDIQDNNLDFRFKDHLDLTALTFKVEEKDAHYRVANMVPSRCWTPTPIIPGSLGWWELGSNFWSMLCWLFMVTIMRHLERNFSDLVLIGRAGPTIRQREAAFSVAGAVGWELVARCCRTELYVYHVISPVFLEVACFPQVQLRTLTHYQCWCKIQPPVWSPSLHGMGWWGSCWPNTT